MEPLHVAALTAELQDGRGAATRRPRGGRLRPKLPSLQELEHLQVELIDLAAEPGQASADGRHRDVGVVGYGHIQDELVECPADRAVLLVEVVLEVPACPTAEVGVDQRESAVQIVVPLCDHLAVLVKGFVYRRWDPAGWRAPLGGPEHAAHPIQAFVEQAAHLFENLHGLLAALIAQLGEMLMRPGAALEDDPERAAEDARQTESENQQDHLIAHRGKHRSQAALYQHPRRRSYAWDVSEEELSAFRSAAHALVDGVADHLVALPSRPVWQPLPDALRSRLLELPLPEHPAELDDLVATALRDVLPHAMGNGHPAFFGWVNPPPSPAGVMASLAAAAMNPSVVSGDHADVHLERAVVRWLAELVGFPHAPGAGLLTSGASAATIVCLAGARSRALAAGGHDVRRDGLAGAPQLTAYVPAEAHSCVRRALELLGLGSGAMREVPLEEGRLDATALRASIAADRASGALPALLVGSAGTVNTGAIDPLDALAEVATAEDLWFHVDGAYGAFGVLDPAIAARYRGMERADSLVLDPHKWLGVPVDAGCALVRRGDDLREAFSLIPPYLRHDLDAPVGTFAEHGFEQTRPFRALKTWATIAARGRAGIAAQVARANALARELATLVEREPELELAAAPETSMVAFRARPEGCPPTRLDDLNRALPEAVQARGRAFVTGTVFGGRETLRACILHPDTGSEHLATLVAEVVACART